MKVDVSAVSNHQKKLTVLVPPGDVRAELDKAYKDLSRRVRLPGFRPGKAPRRVLEAQYGERINADVAQELIQRSWTNILQEHELDPVGRPSVEDSGEVRDAEGFRFIISVDVRPKIELSKWTGLEVVQPPVDIADDEVQQTIAARLEQHAKLDEVTGRACEAGDMALVELHAFDGDEEVATEFGTMIRTEGDPYYPGLESFIVGLEVGGEREGEVTFGEEARTESVAGRTLKVKANLISLQSYVVPELTDEVAAELGYEEGAEGMRTRIREEIVARRTEGAKNQARANVLEAIIAANDFEVPDGMIEQSLEMLKQELRNQQAYITGQDPRTIGFSDAQIADLRQRAVFAAKASLILEWVTDRESVEVTDADLDARYEQLANERGQTIEAVRGWFAKEEAVADLKERILEEKVLDWLLGQSTLVDAPAEAPKAAPEKKAATSAASGDIAVLDGSIDDLKKALASGAHDGGLEALLEAEKGGRNRKGAVTAIQARIKAQG